MPSPVDDPDDKPRPARAETPVQARAQREARLAKALRDNLRRRKSPGRDEPKPPSGD